MNHYSSCLFTLFKRVLHREKKTLYSWAIFQNPCIPGLSFKTLVFPGYLCIPGLSFKTLVFLGYLSKPLYSRAIFQNPCIPGLSFKNSNCTQFPLHPPWENPLKVLDKIKYSPPPAYLALCTFHNRKRGGESNKAKMNPLWSEDC